jgi:hypothetical protein
LVIIGYLAGGINVVGGDQPPGSGVKRAEGKLKPEGVNAAKPGSGAAPERDLHTPVTCSLTGWQAFYMLSSRIEIVALIPERRRLPVVFVALMPDRRRQV